MKNHIKKTLLASACLLSSVAAAQAATSLLVNLGSTTVSGWTQLTGGNTTSISTTSGDYSVSYAVASGGYLFATNTYKASSTTVPSGSYGGYSTSLNEMEATLGLTLNSITTDVWNTGINVGSGQGGTLTISGYTTANNTTYTLYLLIGSSKSKSVTLSENNYVSGSTTIVYDYLNQTSYTKANSNTVSLSAGTGYTLIKMTGVVANESGNIVVTNGGYGVLSAVALIAVPEPSAFGLLAGIGALALVAARRRRSRR